MSINKTIINLDKKIKVKRLNPSMDIGRRYYKTFKGLSNDMNFYDGTQFEKIDDIGNVYNRLVIFNSSQLHAATEYFGDAINNARFFHMFFFDV